MVVQRRSSASSPLRRFALIGGVAAAALTAAGLGVLGAWLLRPTPPATAAPESAPAILHRGDHAFATERPIPTLPALNPDAAAAVEQGRRALDAAERAAVRLRAARQRAQATQARSVTALSYWRWAQDRAAAAARAMAAEADREAGQRQTTSFLADTAQEAAAFSALVAIARRFNGDADPGEVDRALARLDAAKAGAPDAPAPEPVRRSPMDSTAFARVRAEWIESRRDLDTIRQATRRFMEARRRAEAAVRMEAAHFARLAQDARTTIESAPVSE